MCTHIADLPPPPHVRRQPVPLSSERTQTTENLYDNTDFTTSLLAHRYADTPLYVNTSPSNAPLSQAIAFGQSNVTQPSALHAGSYTSNLNSSGLVALHRNIARSSYADNSQRLPIAVDQHALSAFSRVDVPYSRPAIVDSTVQYAVCTSLPSAAADNERPTVTAHPALLQSPSIHWRKWLSSDYVQPDTGPGAPTHAAPATQSGYIRPQTSNMYLPDMSVDKGHSMTSVGPPQAPPPPSSYVPHSHVMPLQVPTVPSALPPSSHLPVTVPISSSAQTYTTYLHVPQTHTVLADVHAPFTHEPVYISTGASIVSLQPQSTTVTTQSQSAMYPQLVPNSAVNFNTLPTGMTATADTVVPPLRQCLRQYRLLLVHLWLLYLRFSHSLYQHLLQNSLKCQNHILVLPVISHLRNILNAYVE